MRSIRSRLAATSPVLVLILLAGLVREGQKWV